MNKLKPRKSTLMFAALFCVAKIAFALPSGGFFLEKGHSQCDLDCAVAEVDAESEAKASAHVVCNPYIAHQVSAWDVTVEGYGRLEASATFSCEKMTDLSATERSCDEAENPSDCSGIANCHWVSKGYGLGCWSN